MSAHAARISRAGDPPPLTATLARYAADSWLAIAIAVAIGAICFGATGGIESSGGTPLAAGLGANVALQIALTLGSGILVAIACALEPAGRIRLFGLGAALALFALAAFTALSVNWSVAPANSWLEANRTLAYAATFAGAIALVRLAAGRWRSVLAGVLVATVAVSVYAVASKVIPETLDAGDTFARLQVPFYYWNAVGLTAALGIGPCLWIGSRREGHGVLSALAAPALCLLLVALMLSYSRGAVLAAVVGVAFWFAVVPLRLRALSLLAIGGVAAAVVVAWSFRQPSLSNNNVALAARSSAGHRLGLLLFAALVIAFLAALVLRFAAERNPLSAQRRRTFGIAALVALALVPVVGVGALAQSSRGLFGEISHGWYELTTPNAQQPSSTASRLTSAGSMQALYWSYALDVFDTSPAVGAGAGAYPIADQRFMTGPALADYAHSYVFQTLADLGLVGIALSLAVAIGWGFAAIRATGPFRARAPGGSSAERVGLLTLITVVITFAVHSAIDWTWFVPGDAVIALLCAGWVAGRGPETEQHAPGWPSLARLARSPIAAATAAAAIALALIIGWSQWQPLRSEQAATAGSLALGNAETALTNGNSTLARREIAAARAHELTAIARNPLDITPLVYLGYSYAQAGKLRLAQATFDRAIALQPSNAASWKALWEFDSSWSYDLSAGEHALYAAIDLNPWDPVLLKQSIELTPIR